MNLQRIATALALTCGFLAPAVATDEGPWHLEALRQSPEATWGETKDGVQEIFYAGEPCDGHATRIFAYYARPKEGDGPFPGVVLVHGGGGKAFADWARQWADRGYAALAMDLAGRGADGERLADAGPDQDDETKFREFADDELDQTWSYHAVAAVLRGCSLLTSLDEVDAERLGIVGISWGGYLTCIAAGIDDRFKAAVSVYGCGFLAEGSVWQPTLEGLPADGRERWVRNFDPANYLAGVRCPMLFVSGTNDYAYPLDSLQKSYRLVREPVSLSIRVKMPHSHPDGWTPKEIGIFIDGVLKEGRPLASIGPAELRGGRVAARYHSIVPITRAEVHYAVADGPWKKRVWQSASALAARDTVSVELPNLRPLVYYLSITDERGAQVCTPHLFLEE